MKQMAGHLLVECLIEQGVTHAFGVPGESYLAVLDGFHAYTRKFNSSSIAKKAARPTWPTHKGV